MEKAYLSLAKHPLWLPDNAISRAKIESNIRSLVCHKGSLTSALIELSDNNFSVKLMNQSIRLPYVHEQRKMQRQISRAAMVREVQLQLYDQSVVFARSIIPLRLVTQGRNGLANLGRTPLGHLLFKNGNIRVSQREFATTQFQDKKVWARRTPYDYQGSQILVSEFFLPTIGKYL